MATIQIGIMMNSTKIVYWHSFKKMLIFNIISIIFRNNLQISTSYPISASR